MKLYRSIEFSRLTFLIDEDHKFAWEELVELAKEDDNYSNWWLKSNNKLKTHQMLKNVISNSNEFFEKSADFNSKIGGRFNPAKSFGAIYTSSCPTLSMLEVLYHVFSSSLGLYNNLKKSSDKLTSSFNVPVPEKIEVLITALELETDDSELKTLCKNKELFKKLCTDLGFNRYIDILFDEDFIFGNDYEITNIIGCHIHSTENKPIKVPSARVTLDNQDNGKFNVVIPEKLVDELNPKLTGNFREYVCVMDMNEEDGEHHISITAKGSNEREANICLQSKPSRKNRRIKEFSQVDDSGENKKRYSREVHLQRFVDFV